MTLSLLLRRFEESNFSSPNICTAPFTLRTDGLFPSEIAINLSSSTSLISLTSGTDVGILVVQLHDSAVTLLHWLICARQDSSKRETSFNRFTRLYRD